MKVALGIQGVKRTNDRLTTPAELELSVRRVERRGCLKVYEALRAKRQRNGKFGTR